MLEAGRQGMLGLVHELVASRSSFQLRVRGPPPPPTESKEAEKAAKKATKKEKEKKRNEKRDRKRARSSSS